MTTKTMRKPNETVINTEYKPRNFIQEQKDNYKARLEVIEGGLIGIVLGVIAMAVAMSAMAIIL